MYLLQLLLPYPRVSVLVMLGEVRGASQTAEQPTPQTPNLNTEPLSCGEAFYRTHGDCGESVGETEGKHLRTKLWKRSSQFSLAVRARGPRNGGIGELNSLAEEFLPTRGHDFVDL